MHPLIAILSKEIQQPASVQAAKIAGTVIAVILAIILTIKLLAWLDDDHRR